MRRSRLLAMLWLALCAPVASAHAVAGDGGTSTAEPRLVGDPDTLWMATFDAPGDWRSNLGIDQFGNSQNASAVQPAFSDTGKVLRVHTPGSPARTNKWGIDMRLGFERWGVPAQEEAFLRYYVYFPEDYAWEEGGKLPGLSGVTEGPGTTSAGGDYHEDSWSGRLYWKQATSSGGGGLVSYLYVKHADGKWMTTKNGRHVGISPRWYQDADPDKGYASFVAGAWNLVEVQYRMNTPGHNDGIHRGWLNGRLAIDLDDVQYRTAAHPDLRINQVFNAVFYGGSVFPASDQDAYFDDMVVSRTYVGPRTDAPATTPDPGDPTAPPDAGGPQISLPVPAPGAQIGSPTTIRPQFASQAQIEWVWFYVDGALVDTDRADNAAYDLDPSTLAAGPHELRVVAIDVLGRATAHVVPFTVPTGIQTAPAPAPDPGPPPDPEPAPTAQAPPATPVPSARPGAGGSPAAGPAPRAFTTPRRRAAPDTTGPSISLPAPRSGALVRAPRELRPRVTDPSGVARVRFHVDGALVATTGRAARWRLDPATFPAGSRTVRIDAEDRRGNVSSLSIALRTRSTRPTLVVPPSVTGPLLSRLVVRPRAGHSSGIASVGFHVDGRLRDVDRARPAHPLDPARLGVGRHRLRIVATAGDGTRTSVTRDLVVARLSGSRRAAARRELRRERAAARRARADGVALEVGARRAGRVAVAARVGRAARSTVASVEIDAGGPGRRIDVRSSARRRVLVPAHRGSVVRLVARDGGGRVVVSVSAPVPSR